MSGEPRTLPEALQHAAQRYPERGVGIFDRRGRAVERRTYAEIHDAARLTASRLRGLGVAPGDRVLISLPTSWEWMDHWFGALLLGAHPAAMAPAAALGSSEGYAQRVEHLVQLLGAARLVAGESLRDELRHNAAEHAAALSTTPGEIASVAADPAFVAATPDPQELAFLQFTSGSTGMPRAVMIPHRAVMHNNRVSDEAIGAPHGANASEWAESMVSWLPMHHDMGLVGCLLLSVNHGYDLWLMNPTTFLARPGLWLDKLGDAGTTFAPAPNFGYQLCVERLSADGLRDVDLSGWRAALTGAEMVRSETVQAFAELAAGCGFRAESFRPCYGLAEGTLAVTFDLRGRGARTLPVPEGADAGLGLSDVVSVGSPVGDTELRISAPDGATLPEGTIGEVRAKGPGIFSGYFNDSEATAQTLQDGWLCTGDLGFLHDGELYLTGRTKDVLILRGNNVMPHELEWLAEEVVGGGGSLRCGAFSLARGADGEEAVMVVETNQRDPETLAAMDHEIRVRVGRALSLPLADLAFVKRGRIPKTTSGKVQRGRLRQVYLDGALERLGG